MTRNLIIGRKKAKMGVKCPFHSRNSTNNKCKPKNLPTSYIIPYIVIFKQNLELNDTKSNNWTRKGENGRKMAFSFPKFNQQQMQA